MSKKITIPVKDNYVHHMLFKIYDEGMNGDPSYYELFESDIEDKTGAVAIDCRLFCYDCTVVAFSLFENNKFNYTDSYVTRYLYTSHYVAYCVLSELTRYYRHNTYTFSDGSITWIPNESAFKRIKPLYIGIMGELIYANEKHGLIRLAEDGDLFEVIRRIIKRLT